VAVGIAAVEAGHRVRYFTAAELVETLYRGVADNSVGRLIDTLLRNELVLIDELGFRRWTTPARSCCSGLSPPPTAEGAATAKKPRSARGVWHDRSRGDVTFADYVETVRLPSKHVETSTLAAYRSYLDKHFIHLQTQTDGQNPARGDPALGRHRQCHRRRERPLGRVGAQVPHDAALGLGTLPARPGRHRQPLRPHRAPKVG
jgi:hypothetical protein